MEMGDQNKSPGDRLMLLLCFTIALSLNYPSTDKNHTVCDLHACLISILYILKILPLHPSSPESSKGCNPAAASLGSCLGNHPYCPKSTISSPMLLLFTVTPSARRA